MVTDGSDPVRVLRAEGELDLALVPPLLARVPELVEGAAGLVLDLRPVTFLDSRGSGSSNGSRASAESGALPSRP